MLLDTRASSDPNPHGLGLDPQVFEVPTGRHSRVSSLSKASRRDSIQSVQSFVAESSPIAQAAKPRKPSQISPGAFSRPRNRGSVSSPAFGVAEPLHNRLSDSADSGLLNCIFGSSAFSYRGSSTKMHVLSTDNETAEALAASPPQREMDYFASRTMTPRSSLARAHSSGTHSTSSSYFRDQAHGPKPPSKVTVLITRMFSVNLPEGRESVDPNDSPAFDYHESHPRRDTHGFNLDGNSNGIPRKVREKKTPMYAVALSIQIPLSARNVGRPISRLGPQGADAVKPVGLMSFSLDSDHRWSSAILDDHFSIHSQSANIDDRIDLLVDHWDVITRTLSHLERIATREILFLLKKVDTLSGLPLKPLKAPNMQRINQTIVQLPANILSGHSRLRDEVLMASQRISAALRIPRVVTGQSRWGVWREEARLIARILGDKEHGFFFLVLITAFLGNHTEWLNSLGPDWYRRRHYLQQKAQQDGEPIVSNRTVIISSDKMTARRMVFLLASFLPAKQRFEALGSPLQPGRPASFRPFSQSPPSAPILRQESLRRTINRRARARRLNMDDEENRERSVSISSAETAHKSPEDVDAITAVELQNTRRDSDVRSIRTASLPIRPNESRLAKSSAATTSTTTPSTAVPVPHFAARHSRRASGGWSRLAVDGNDSPASANLLQNLRRSESSGVSPNSNSHQGSSKWGNLLSGFWSSRQGSLPTPDGKDISTDVRRKRVTEHVEHAAQSPVTGNIAPDNELSKTEEPIFSDNIAIPSSSPAHQTLGQGQHGSLPSIDHSKDFPLKLSVRPEDGVVDVHLPLPGFVSLSSSGDSTLTSPKRARTSITSVDAIGSTHSSNSNSTLMFSPSVSLKESEGLNINVAGWLKNFHEDFLLQAVKPYSALDADIKRAMAAEATPHLPYATVDGDNMSVTEKWVDVATTLVADTRTCTVKRLRLRRKIQTSSIPCRANAAMPRQFPENASSATQFPGFIHHTTRSRKNSTATIADWTELNGMEEQFTEELVMDLDGTLVDAVERVLVQSGQSSLAHSRAPSPHRNHKGEYKMRAESATRSDSSPIEVPRSECRKMVLGALEEVVRSVTADHCREDMDSELGLVITLSGRERRKTLSVPDNTLREGIRKWLLDVEEVC
ncbi:hypothetical protein Egran_05471, partial [Elaphomyces granulatus]